MPRRPIRAWIWASAPFMSLACISSDVERRVRLAGCAGLRTLRFVRGAIAAGHPLTADAGARVLREGGGAVDACIAAAFVSWVCESPLTGPGGGGFMLVHDAAILSGPQIRLLEPLLEKHPQSLSRTELANAAGYQPNTGTFNTYLGQLSTLNLIAYPERGFVRAEDWLFP